jgi:hypothetical protein
MSLRIEVADLGLASLDALDVDALAVLVGPERPLQGFSGYVDWRLCGAISRAILDGHFAPEKGEALLLPSGRRLGPPRVFCFGLGPEALDATGFAAVARKACDAMARAGSASFATALPALAGGEGSHVAARLWLEASLRHTFSRQVLLGEARTLHRDLGAARQSLSAPVEVAAAHARVEPAPRGAAGLPGRSPVVR